MFRSILCLIVYALINGLIAGQEKPKPDFEKTLQTIRKSRLSQDWGILRKTTEEIKESWPESSYQYSKLVFEVCSLINSTPMKTKEQRDFLQSLAISTVENEKGPLELMVRISAFIQYDIDPRENNTKGKEWVNTRRKISRTMLRVYKSLNREVDRKFDFTDRPALNLTPPGGKYPSGISPESIKDPEIRKEYEAALKANSEKAKKHYRQRDLHDLETQYLRNIEINTVRAYSIEPVNIDEVTADFKEHGIPQDLTNRVVQKLELRAMALSNKLPPPKMEITELQPPGTGPHHADPRLCKKLTFNLAAPKVEEVLAELQQLTGVDLARASDIQNQYSATGSISVVGVPAWQVMDDLAASERVEGRWETDGTGYRLVGNGNPVNISEEPPASHVARNILIAAAASLLLAIVSALIFMKRRAKSANKPESGGR